MAKKMTSKTIIDILGEYVPTDPVQDDMFWIRIYDHQTEPDEQGNYPLLYEYTYDNVIRTLIERYGEWSFVYCNVATRYTNPNNNPLTAFFVAWVDYKMDNMLNWERIGHTYQMQYNPIHNYDRNETETSKRDYGDYKTEKFADYNIETKLPTTTTTHQYGNGADDPDVNSSAIITTSQATTYNDVDNLVDTTRDTTTGSEKTVVSYNGDVERVTYNGEKQFNNTGYDYLNEHNIQVSGNIGVTTTQQMIADELKLRQFDMFMHIIDNFAKEYLVLLPDTDDDDDDWGCCW